MLLKVIVYSYMCTGMRGSGSSKDFFCRARIGIVFPFVWDSGEGGGPAVGGFDFSAGILENAVKYSRTTDEVSVFSGGCRYSARAWGIPLFP